MSKEMLINVREEDGKQIVSCKELYDGLGLNKAHWKRWYEKNIECNEFFIQNVDWEGFTTVVNGNETKDFAITLDFAKHIAMMARTEKSHEFRNYFINCEKKLLEVKHGLIATNNEVALMIQSSISDAVIRFENKAYDMMNTIDDKVNKLEEQGSKNHRPSHKTKLDYWKIICRECFSKDDRITIKELVLSHFDAGKWEDITFDKNIEVVKYIKECANSFGCNQMSLQ